MKEVINVCSKETLSKYLKKQKKIAQNTKQIIGTKQNVTFVKSASFLRICLRDSRLISSTCTSRCCANTRNINISMNLFITERKKSTGRIFTDAARERGNHQKDGASVLNIHT